MEGEQAERVRRGGEKGPRTGRTQGSYADPGDPGESRKGEKIGREQEERRGGVREGEGGRGGAFERSTVTCVSRGGTRPSRGDIATVVTAVTLTVLFVPVWLWAWAANAGVRAPWGSWLWPVVLQCGPCWAAP